MDVNVKGVWLSLKHEIPAMLRTGGGSIVNTSSVAGVIGMAGVAIYVASKHAVIGLTKAVALEFRQGRRSASTRSRRPRSIPRCSSGSAGDKPELRSAVMGAHPVGRMGTPEEIADAVVWLLSDKASFVTGTALLADGGLHRRVSKRYWHHRLHSTQTWCTASGTLVTQSVVRMNGV